MKKSILTFVLILFAGIYAFADTFNIAGWEVLGTRTEESTNFEPTEDDEAFALLTLNDNQIQFYYVNKEYPTQNIVNLTLKSFMYIDEDQIGDESYSCFYGEEWEGTRKLFLFFPVEEGNFSFISVNDDTGTLYFLTMLIDADMEINTVALAIALTPDYLLESPSITDSYLSVRAMLEELEELAK